MSAIYAKMTDVSEKSFAETGKCDFFLKQMFCKILFHSWYLIRSFTLVIVNNIFWSGEVFHQWFSVPPQTIVIHSKFPIFIPWL